MLEKAICLLQPSVRSAVPPFMVMDVMAAARRLEDEGRHIVHMEVGQPAAALWVIPRRLALARCANASRAPMPIGTASMSRPIASW
jgi:hypothetical protein